MISSVHYFYVKAKMLAYFQICIPDLQRYTFKNALVKNKAIFVLIEGFHLPQRQISLQKQPPEMFWKIGVLSNFTKFLVKHLCQSLFLQASASEKRDPETDVFMRNLWNIFFTEHLWATASVIMSRQNLSLQSAFLIKLYQPEENPTVGHISEKDVQCFYVHAFAF